MPSFQPGNMVVHVPSQSIGTVVQVLPVRGGMQLYQVRFDMRSAVVPEQQLIEYLDLTDEFERCRRGLFGTNEQFAIKNTTFKISNQSVNSIATMMASKTDFKPYQYIPLLKFLYSANKRLLVADEVGLGKTIEAGHIMMELKARHELKNVLIICPNSLITKWKDEMLERFDLRFKAYGTGMSSDFRNDLLAEYHSLFAIVNYEKVRDQRLQNIIKENNITFDLVVCDEAHKMRNHTAATHEGARTIVEKARAAVFLTATPVMTSENNLFWLLNILDKQAYDNQYLFGNALRENAPLVRALSRLGDMSIPVADILDELDQAEIVSTYSVGENIYTQTQTIHDKFAKVPVYNHIIAQKKAPDSYELRVGIQSDISSLNVLNGIFTRNRKVDVLYEEPQAQREAKPCYIPFTKEERILYEKTLAEYKYQHTYIDSQGNERWEEGYALGYTSLERQLASSLFAAVEGPIEALKHPDAKYDALHEVYDEVVGRNGRKLIVFAVYNDTIDYLKARFLSEEIPICVINSDLDVDARRAELKEFKTNPDKYVLIASEVGSEGLDMQFCDALVNYDLPWNPMVVEQRIGRIDRIGQKSPIINIYNMVMQDTIHERIYYRLLDRINIFESCIGDLEAILDSEYVPGKTLHDALDELPRQLYRLDLTEEEKEVQQQRIEMAIIHEKTNLDNVSETLTDTLTNDVYFRNEIHSMKRNYRYVTAHEIRNYIESIIRDELTTCTLMKQEECLYSLQIPRSNLSALTSFLTANEPLNNDRRVDYNKFISSIRGLSELLVTFDRDYARENPSIAYIDPFHPLVMACMNYYSTRESTDNTFEFSLNSSAFADLTTISKGEYFLGIYMVELTKTLYGSRQTQHIEIPLLYDVQNNCLVKGKEETMRMMGESQQNAQIYHPERPISPEVIDSLQGLFPAEIERLAQDMRDDAEMHLESSKQMEINRLTEFYTNRIRQQERVVEELRGLASCKDEDSVRRFRTLPMQETNLVTLQHDFDEALCKVSSGKVELTRVPTLVTLSHIVII